MTLQVDYAEAHRRHWDDAELLFSNARLGNADHLYGFSAECGLKAVMKALGMRVGRTGKPPKDYQVHIQDLWPEFKVFVKGRGGRRFLKQLPGGSPFSDWSHNDRYAREGYGRTEGVNQHRVAALGIRRMITRAKQDGTL